MQAINHIDGDPTNNDMSNIEVVTVHHSLTHHWQPIATAPTDGTYVLVAGDSGYTTTPLRVEVCRYDAEYRPLSPWINHANDCFTDGGPPPTLWAPLPTESC